MALAGDHVQIYVDGSELTGDLNHIGFGDRCTLHDVTTFGDAAHKFIAGQRQVTLEHAGYLNAQAARSHPVLRTGTVQGVVSVLLGQNAAPVVGDPAYSLRLIQGRYTTLPETARAIPFSAQLAGTGSAGGWGRALAINARFTSSTSGAGVDEGTATTRGGAVFLHIVQAAVTDTYSISVEGATNAAFTTGVVTLGTFALTASAVGSEQLALAGSIPQFVRFRATRTGTAGNLVRLSMTLVRF